MGLMDTIFTDRPFYGSRRILQDLRQDYHEQINRKRVIRLMREMGLEGGAAESVGIPVQRDSLRPP